MTDCIFCRIVVGEIPGKKVYEDADALAILDIAPYQPGHTLVISKRHVANALTDAGVLASLAPAIAATGRLLMDRLDAQGMNVLSNVNEVAGQSVYHLHVHLLPRFDSAPGIEAMLRRPGAIDVDAVHALLAAEA